MEKSEAINIATIAVVKRMDYETLKYSDYLYGKEDQVDLVWEYVDESGEIGRKAFREKYSEYKLHHGY